MKAVGSVPQRFRSWGGNCPPPPVPTPFEVLGAKLQRLLKAAYKGTKFIAPFIYVECMRTPCVPNVIDGMRKMINVLLSIV